MTSPLGVEMLRRVMADPREDLGLAGSDWMRKLPADERSALLEQRALRVRAQRKHVRAAELFLTPLGMQQMTLETLALYKAGRIPKHIRSIADLCCGLGADSFHLPQSIFVAGVDWNAEACRAYLHNVGLFRPAAAVQADVTRFHARVDGILLDPARRSLASTAHGRSFDSDPEPGWDAILALIRRYRHVVLKLGPGVKLPETLIEEECEYLGFRDECLELSVRTGAFGRPGMMRAVELPSGESLEAPTADLQDTFDRVEEPGTYFYEPVKCVVRAHLFGVLAGREGLWQVDGRIAYLSGNHRVDTPLLKRYRVVRQLPCDEAVLRREVRSQGVGILEIKKRGMEIDPEVWRKKLKPNGPGSATLVFTRLRGKGAVLWVEPD